MVLPAIGLGLASAGLNFFGAKSSADAAHRQAKQQTKLANQQSMAQRAFENLQIRKQNEYTRQAYDTQKQLYGQQVQFNQDAANRAYDGIQINRNRQFRQMAFSRFDMTNELMEAVGANQAGMEGDNRSARLAAAKSTYGRFGQQQAQMQEQTGDINRDARMQMRDTALQQYGADLQAYSQVAIAPYMQSELPPAMQMPMPKNNFNTGLAIGSAVMGGLSTFNQFAPEGAQIQNWFAKKKVGD